MLKLYLLFWIVTIACGSDSDPTQLEAFFGDIIDTWHIASPTIIAQDSLPALCMRHPWVLCLSSEMEREDVMEHLTVMHQTRKQDGVILDGNEGHEGLLKKLVDTSLKRSLFAKVRILEKPKYNAKQRVFPKWFSEDNFRLTQPKWRCHQR